MSSLFGRLVPNSRRQVIPSSDAAAVDLEAQQPSSPSSVELDHPVLNDEAIELSSSIGANGQTVINRTSAGVEIPPNGPENVPQPTAGANATREATATEPNNDPNFDAALNWRITLLQRMVMLLIGLSVLQFLSIMEIEHGTFFPTVSVFVMYFGYQGTKHRDYLFLRAFYWACWIMIPYNFFHYLSFQETMQEILSTTPLDENLKKELMFNHKLFNIVTVSIIVIMTFSLVLARQVSLALYPRWRRLMTQIERHVERHFMNTADRRASYPTGPLSQEEIAAIAGFKLTSADLDTEAGEQEVCVICQEEYQENDLVKRLRCKHMFHAHCIDAWLQRSCHCPICNGEVRTPAVEESQPNPAAAIS